MVDLPSLYREEKTQKVLCALPDNFYEVAKAQISDMEDNARYLEGTELDLMKEAILTDRRALKNINDQRIKKLCQSAISDAYRDKPAHALDSMLPDEKAFYDNLVNSIKSIRI